MKSKLKTIATPKPKPKKPKPKAAYLLAVKIVAEVDDTEKF